ncbi:glucosaminidase domain-containing protein [Sedimentibacter hydroxybenzoicus DSM 7310]|uniref:Glucosaminidase domain-containing protein n=1 Tax=Sedimentibacter hydroxybenzoicus DSM 7310 TaxID=1123245 RepID=A0A974BIB8_SEDHY|nr:stalk domain-containing protein [Sedimentibacter hydroxybenzoicus]NYB73205.1 glucosaminidase domain-containing protein [Sedimentibacter hydroxybenzoicus DSM 7310]
MRKKVFSGILIAIFLVIALFNVVPRAYADGPIRIIIDGKRVTSDPEPFIKNDRTFVPIRIIAEELDAEVSWDNEKRIVHISKDDMQVSLVIDSHLIEYTIDNETIYNLSDVAPLIQDDRTFVPIRLVSNALGVGIDWDNDKRAVVINPKEKSSVEPFFDVSISSVKPGQVITGTSNLSITTKSEIKGAAEIKYLLLNPDTKKGFVIAKGANLTGSYKWIPAMEDSGSKVLVAAIYDKNGKFLAGDSIPVKVNIIPDIKLKGLTEGQLVTIDSVPLTAELNFAALYVKYEIINPDTGAYYISSEQDPLGSFTMVPEMEDNGNMSLRVIAYDTKGNPYYGPYTKVKVEANRIFSLGGVSQNQTIDGSVTLRTVRNFRVSETEYVVVDANTGSETVLYKAGYGNYTWFPGPDMAGSKQLYVRVKDAAGNTFVSNKINVNVAGNPKVSLQSVAPGQVVTDTVNLKVGSNVTLDSVKYILTNTDTGEQKVLTGQTFTPAAGDGGSWSLRAESSYAGKVIKTEDVKFTIYTGKLYPAQAIIEKDKFLDFASKLAVDAQKKSGMSAALQTAQAILETGWGQSVPVDKYNGKFSYNMFGIKGSSTNGSVTSNTWEVYNGVSFRVDDSFRAYNNVNEAWDDHKDLLLTRDRYQPFREVMYNSMQGAWALKRCGYATDPVYAIKLVNLINSYDLNKLDETGI